MLYPAMWVREALDLFGHSTIKINFKCRLNPRCRVPLIFNFQLSIFNFLKEAAAFEELGDIAQNLLNAAGAVALYVQGHYGIVDAET